MTRARYIALLGGPFNGRAYKTDCDDEGKPLNKWLHCVPAFPSNERELSAEQLAQIDASVALYKRSKHQTHLGGFVYWTYQFTDATEGAAASPVVNEGPLG